MATIHDVARHAQVSTATVSRALNGKQNVDPGLVQRVQVAARALDYRPNGPARNLRRQVTAVWALIISDIENPFFTSIARGVEDVASAAGFSVVLCNSDEDPAKEDRYLQVAVQERVAGVILSPTSAGSDVAGLAETGIPVVAIDRPLSGAGTDTVLVGSRRGAAGATAHLLEQGYQRIGCVTGPAQVSTAEDRLAGYLDALRAGRRRPARSLVRYADFKVAGGRQAAAQLLAQRHRPDALFVANSLMAVGVLETAAALGLRPGRDLGLVAFDDPPWAGLVDPPMTVVAQPAYEIGQAAGRRLAERVSGTADRPSTVILSTRLVVRGSSRPG